MNQTLSSSRDPVCGMQVDIAGAEHSATYRDVVFHFCSSQCRERFDDNPALYALQRIADIRPMPKRHALRLAAGTAADVARACQRVGEMMGISAVRAEQERLIVDYDLRQVALSQIEAVAAAEGLRFKDGLHGFRRGLWKFTEANELANAAHPGTGACCSRPPAGKG